MRKLFTAMLLCAGLVHAIEYRENFPDGRYLGQGNWSNSLGEEGIYVSYAEINSNTIATDYVWSDGHASISVTFAFSGDGWFDVIYQGDQIGKGFCMVYQCQYDMDIGPVHYTETFTFDEEHFHKIGHRISGTKISRWEDKLFKLDVTNTTTTESMINQKTAQSGPIE